MPSYHLTTKMNLGDVDSIYKAKTNLNIGPFVEQDSNNIFITDGHIEVDHFILEAPNASSNMYLTTDDNSGRLKWSTAPVANWAQHYLSNVSLAGFSNDIHFAYKSNVSDFALTSRFVDLHNEPTVSDIIPFETKSNILRAYCNLSELADNTIALDNIYSNLELKALAFKNATLTTIRDITILENFYIFGNCNQVGNLLKASASNDDIQFDTSMTKWYDVFYDSYSNLRDVFTLIHGHSNETTTSSVTAATLSNVFESLNSTILSKQGFTDQEIEVLMSQRMMQGEFLVKNSNLSESILENVSCSSNLELGDLALAINNGSITNAQSVLIENSFNWNGSEEIFATNNYQSNEEVFLTTKATDLGSIDLTQLQLSTFSNEGLVVFNSNILSDAIVNPSDLFSFCNEVANSYTLSNIHTNMQYNLCNLQTTVYYVFPDFNDNGLIHFLDDRLSQFTEFPNIRPTAYLNLKLATVAHTSLYNDLITAPTTLLPFSNDIGFLLRDEHGSEYTNNAFDCRTTLLCGDIASQNRHMFNIDDGNANLADSTVYDSFTHKSTEDDVLNKWMKCVDDSTGALMWTDLHKATAELKGVVKELSSYTIADYEATVNAKVFNDMYHYFDSNINRIEEKMKSNGIL